LVLIYQVWKENIESDYLPFSEYWRLGVRFTKALAYLKKT